MNFNVILAGATQQLLDHVVLPTYKKYPQGFFTLVTANVLSYDKEKFPRVTIITKDDTTEVVKESIKLAKETSHPILMKGLVQTAELFKEVLKTENNLKTDQLLSQVGRIKLEDGTEFLLSDAGINIAPDVEDKIQITENAYNLAKSLGWQDIRVALLSSVEVVNPRMSSTVEAEEVANHFVDHQDLIVEGPLSFDVAMDEAAAKLKGYKGKIQGNANILIAPNIDVANVLYKALNKLMPVQGSSILTGAKIPIILTSRADDEETIIHSLQLAIEVKEQSSIDDITKDKVLVINPGSTSTKLAIFKDREELVEQTISHTYEDLAVFKEVNDQIDFRKKLIDEFMETQGIKQTQLRAIAGRGGLLRPIEGGTYHVNEAMVTSLLDPHTRDHASNLGALIGHEYAKELNIPAYIVDPVVVDELADVARISGNKHFERKSVFHALNQKAVARKVAEDLGKTYDEGRFIVAHLGGGISIGVHLGGRVVDVNDGLDGEGPFSPERAGSLPMGQFADFSYFGYVNDYSRQKIKNELVGQGGLVSYLETNDLREVEQRMENGDEEATIVFEALAYQIGKYIGSLASVAQGDLDGIILTGGMANSKRLVDFIKSFTEWIAPIFVESGGFEMEALNEGVLRVLNEEEESKVYTQAESELEHVKG